MALLGQSPGQVDPRVCARPAGSLKSGPQPFKVAEGLYLVNVYYPRCKCGKVRVKACAEQGHPYNMVRISN